MPTTSEKNQFRRLVGDYGKNDVTDAEVKIYLDDATRELTADFTPSPVTDFDVLVVQYHPEVIYKAAINFWWSYATMETEKYSVSTGAVASDQGKRWDKAMGIIEKLEEYYKRISQLEVDITVGNFTRFSKITLTTLGGDEVAALDRLT